jgi:hypothetical protein
MPPPTGSVSCWFVAASQFMVMIGEIQLSMRSSHDVSYEFTRPWDRLLWPVLFAQIAPVE